jgi:hypothetical protein
VIVDQPGHLSAAVSVKITEELDIVMYLFKNFIQSCFHPQLLL